jgi:hypothetical protein
MLNSLPLFSRLGTCLTIRLADHAAQKCGYRSTRQVDDSKLDDVEESYSEMLNTLRCQIDECIEYIDDDHIYKDEIYSINEDSLEDLIEDVLFEMTIYDCSLIFKEMMFN